MTSTCSALSARRRGDGGRVRSAIRATAGAVLAFALLLAAPAAAQALEQKLIAGDGVTNAQAGNAVAIEGDTAVLGAPGDAAGVGAVYVFTRSGDTWTQVAKLTRAAGAAGEGFGFSVGLDGDTIVAGAPLETVGADNGQGAAYVFTGAGASWTQTGRLTVSDGEANDNASHAIAIDGDTIVVGAYAADAARGAAYTFDRTGGAERSETAKLTASDGAPVDLFGSSVAIDAGTIVVGAFFADVGTTYDQGAAWVFTGSGGTWTERAKLTASDAAADDWFGAPVDIDGDTIVAGATSDDGAGSDRGSAYVFTGAGATWAQSATLTASDAADDDQFGSWVAVDGDTIVAGAHFDDVGANANQGSVYPFARTAPNTWAALPKLVASDGAAGDRLGFTVAVDGTTILAGDPRDQVGANTAQGSAVVFFVQAPGAFPVSLPGVVRLSTIWLLRTELSDGPATTTFSLGTRPVVPFVGDWDANGSKTPGTFKGGVLSLYLNLPPEGDPSSQIPFGDARGFPVTGDFDGDGLDDVAIYRNGTWQIRFTATGTTTTVTFGAGAWPATVPVAGDWDGDGTDGIGTYVGGTWTLRDTITGGDDAPFAFAPGAAPYPVVGDWNGDGIDTVGVKAGTGSTWSLSNSNSAPAVDRTIGFGLANDLPMVWR